jgi:RecB family exonuclease
MRPLPSALDTVEVPDFLSPSALGTWGGCVLKLVMASRSGTAVERVGMGPEAAIGTFSHRVISRCASAINTLSPPEVFAQELALIREELSRDCLRAHFSDLAATRPPSEWTRLRAWVLSRCEREVQRAAGGSRGRGVRLGADAPLADSSLRLRGSADRVRRLGPNVFEVRDFKSAVVLAEDGAIKSEIRMQLLAYGLVVCGKYPRATVRLIVDDGEEHEIEFERDAARRLIGTVIDRVPPAGAASAESLASPGPGCWGCAVRHVCKGYRVAAPAWWKDYPAGLPRLPTDTWGRVLEVSRGDRLDVVLEDAAGRRVRVERIDARHGCESARVDSRLWFVDLESSGSGRDFEGRRFHPRGFHDFPRDRRERRAWRLQVFQDP